MFEKTIYKILANTLGNYIEEFNPNDIKIKLLKGDIQLFNLVI